MATESTAFDPVAGFVRVAAMHLPPACMMTRAVPGPVSRAGGHSNDWRIRSICLASFVRPVTA